MSFRIISLGTCGLIVAAGGLRAEIESLLGGNEFLLATDHSSPEQIGPIIHHHEYEAQEDRLAFELSAGADSRYVSEGRDNLPGEGGIVWGNLVGHVHVLGGALFGQVVGIAGWEANYQELNLAAGYEFALGPVTVGAAVTYLWFPDSDEDDLELGLSAEWICQCGAGLAAEAVWSTEADGWFGEAKLFYEWAVCEHFTLVPSVFLGVNQGYVSVEHDGLNHFGAQLEGSVPIAENVEASAFAAFLEPLDEEAGESLRDLFWFGGAVTVTF